MVTTSRAFRPCHDKAISSSCVAVDDICHCRFLCILNFYYSNSDFIFPQELFVLWPLWLTRWKNWLAFHGKSELLLWTTQRAYTCSTSTDPCSKKYLMFVDFVPGLCETNFVMWFHNFFCRISRRWLTFVSSLDVINCGWLCSKH